MASMDVDAEGGEEEDRKKQLKDLRREQERLFSLDKAAAARQRLEFITRHTEILLHFNPKKGNYAQSMEDKSSGRRHRKTEKEEDEELLKDERAGGTAEVRLTQQPTILCGGQLRDYQLEGLNWLIHLFHNGINGILADEMGLGKTIQSIAMLSYLYEYKNYKGPFIIITPKSTLSNWMGEFKKWAPQLRPVRFHGSKEEREEMMASQLQPEQYDAIVTTYEVVNSEKSFLRKILWKYLIIDEAHRIKNENSTLAQTVRLFDCNARLLLTGTPLQNNLHELWALLNFLLPDEFDSSEEFDDFFKATEDDTATVTQKLHKILRPFLLRRLKADVEKGLPPKREINIYIPLSRMQKKLYTNLLKKDIDAINGAGGQAVRLLNIVMQLRKCCNHPYLFEGQEPGPPYIEGEHLVENSGKLIALDKLLIKLKTQGSRVLIFSQMTRMLDILEDYCNYRGHKYCRIDGSITGEVRDAAIEAFQAPGSDRFIFLLSTRAGGLGINLHSADQVVLFDSDWNPQADIQAMDRAHRIGQKKPVFVYRFITEGAIEEKIVERAFKKLFLDAIVIQQGRLIEKNKTANKDELLEMIRFGADEVVRLGDVENPDFDIDEVLRSGEVKTAELTTKLKEAVGKSFASNFTMDGGGDVNVYQLDGVEYSKSKGRKADSYFLDLGSRQRTNQGYNLDQSFRDQMRQGGRDMQKVGPRLPKHLQPHPFHDFQFYNMTRLNELLEKKREAWTIQQEKDKEAGEEGKHEDLDVNAGLTPEEIEEEKVLLTQGFDWNRKDFSTFKSACERYGRNAFEEIANDVGKSVEDVKAYSAVFWARSNELADHERIITTITKGESKIKKRKECMTAVARKIAKHPNAWQTLKIAYGPSKGKAYTEEEDRFIVCMTNQLGYGRWEELKCEIRKAWNFRFDWFIKSRKPMELENRFKTLVRLIQKELDTEDVGRKKSKAKLGDVTVPKPKRKEPEEMSAVAAAGTGMGMSAGAAAVAAAAAAAAAAKRGKK